METDNIWGLKVNPFSKKKGTIESEIETQVPLNKTILRAEWWVLASIMGKQFKIFLKRSKFETLGKRNCLQWQQKKNLQG